MALTWPEERFREVYSEYGAAWFESARDSRYSAVEWVAGRSLRQSRILVVGCGLGLLFHLLRERGFPNVWGIDSATWISRVLSDELPEMAPLVLEASINSGHHIESALLDMTGGARFDLVVSEQSIEGQLSDAEQWAFCHSCDYFGERVGHIVNALPRCSLPFALKTIEEWESVFPSHDWVSVAQMGRLAA